MPRYNEPPTASEMEAQTDETEYVNYKINWSQSFDGFNVRCINERTNVVLITVYKKILIQGIKELFREMKYEGLFLFQGLTNLSIKFDV